MRTTSELLDRCRFPVGLSEEPLEIASVGLVTCNRIGVLKRGLTSYIENTRQHGRTNDFVVMDDTPKAETRSAYREMLRSMKRSFGVKIFYAGLEEKNRFARKLIGRGRFAPEVVNFALFGAQNCRRSAGANMNALLLHTIGDGCFCADDDTVCRIASFPGPHDGLALVSGRDPSEYFFFPDRETALRSVVFSETDLLSLHEQLLGRDLAGIVAAHGGNVDLDFDRGDCALLQRVDSGPVKVLATFNGLVGDCGWGAPFGYWGAPMGSLWMDGESHQRLVRSESDYRCACTTREIARVVNRPTLSDEKFCMTGFLGLDNRRLLPPVMPVQRGQDRIFGITLWRCFRDSCLGHLPWALLHTPADNRRFWPGEIFRTASGYDTAKLMIDCIHSFEFGPSQTDAEERLRALGEHLTALGSMSPRDFDEFARLQALRTNREFMSRMEDRLRACEESPQFWARDVRRYLELLRQSLASENYCLPLDLMDECSMPEARALARRLVLQFGQLLYWWAPMLEAARELRANGERLAEPI